MTKSLSVRWSGAQYLSMGRELYDQYDVKSTFEEASQI